MIKVKCLGKNRNNKGNIINYNLQDETGRQFQATAQQIKAEIRKGQYEFINLQIDKAGRLVDKAEEKTKIDVVNKPKVGMTGGLNVVGRKPAPVVTKQLTEEEKRQQEANMKILELAKRNAKEELSNYIKMMAKEYTNDNWGEDKFTEDYLGENRMGEKLEDCKMTEIARKYFKKLIDSIENKALDEGIEAYRTDYTDFSVTLSDEVENFIKKSGCETCIKEAMFNLAGRNEKLAIITCGIDTLSDGFVGCKFLTGSYEEAKRFISMQLVGEADNRGMSPIEVMNEGSYINADNDLGRVFVLKFYADVQGHDVKYYEEKVIEQFERVRTGDKDSDYIEIFHILNFTTEGLTYLALKRGIIHQRDDCDTEAKWIEKLADRIMK